MKNSVIVSAKRTAIGSFMGGLSTLSAVELGAHVIGSVLRSSGLKPADIDEVIMGQVLQGGVGQAPARQAALGAGLLSKTLCTTVNKVCGSGLKAIMLASQSIALSQSKIIIAGGMESMSNAPYILPNARQGFRMGHHKVLDMMIHDGLFDPYGQSHMGNFGDMCAREHKFSREDQDSYAKLSYEKAIHAQTQGYFKDEISPIKIKTRQGEIIFSEDEEPAKYQPAKFASLKPSFDVDGTVTAANASKINDGAAAVIIMSEDEARARNMKPLAKIIGYETYAHDPQWFTTAPSFAINKLLTNTNISIKDIDLFEINEAFSVVAMSAIRELGLPSDRVNIFGGAVALGHPIGCSGARLIVTLLNSMNIKQKTLGCASLCLGGGEAVAMIIQKI